MKKKLTWKKVWHFIWHDDSFLSWVVNIILAFVLIKFIIYPGIGLVLGTPFPVVAVVSNSMEHEDSFYDWWAEHEDFYLKHNITDIDFKDYIFTNGFNKGDIMVLIGTDPKKIDVGDVIVYHAKKPYPIIHRVISIRDTGGELYFETKGDNNKFQIRSFDLDEENVSSDAYVGRAIMRLPWLGYIKIWFVALMDLFGLGTIFS